MSLLLLGLYVKKPGLHNQVSFESKLSHRLFKTNVGSKQVLYVCSFSKNLS